MRETLFRLLFIVAGNSNLLEEFFVHLVSLLREFICSINSIDFIQKRAGNVKRKVTFFIPAGRRNQNGEKTLLQEKNEQGISAELGLYPCL